MAETSTISRPLLRWLAIKPLLCTIFLAELLAWLLLRGELWQKLGLGWQLWSLVVVTAATVTLAIIAGVCFLRQRAQFGLRTLLFLMLVVATGLGLIGMKLRSTEKQRRAVASLEQIGAGFSYVGEERPGLLTFLGRKHFQEPVAFGFSGTLRESDLVNIEALTGLEFLNLVTSLSDDDLAHLTPLKRLRGLNLIGNRVTGPGLQHLSANADLQCLDLCRCPIDNEGLKYVSQLRTLTTLNVNSTLITDTGLARLTTLSELRVLHLDCNKITGSGLTHLGHLGHLERLSLDRTWIGNPDLRFLREIKSLTWLSLANTSVDDDGLEALSDMPGLKTLQLSGTGVTKDGVQRLKRALPDCQISSHY